MQLDGEAEDFPYVWLGWGRPQDWRGYQRLRVRFRLLAQTPHVPYKIVRFVVYDANTRWLNREGQPAKQQLITLMAETDRWLDVDLSLLGVRRGAVTALSLYCYELPPGHAHSLRWEIQRLELVGSGPGQCVFDGCLYPAETLRLGRVAPSVTWDGPERLRLGFSEDGRIADLWAGTHIVAGGRAIARTKMLTDLPSHPRPAWELHWHLLYGIFPGWGNRQEDLARVFKPLTMLSAAEWQPRPGLRISHPAIAVERFGSRTDGRVFWVFHNTSGETVRAQAEADPQFRRPAKPSTVRFASPGCQAQRSATGLSLEVTPHGTVMISID